MSSPIQIVRESEINEPRWMVRAAYESMTVVRASSSTYSAGSPAARAALTIGSRDVVLVAVWTDDGCALLAIAVVALSFVDLLPADVVHLVHDTPHDVIGVTGAECGEFPALGASFVPPHREPRHGRDGHPPCRGDPTSEVLCIHVGADREEAHRLDSTGVSG